jgi:hypothetical protein
MRRRKESPALRTTPNILHRAAVELLVGPTSREGLRVKLGMGIGADYALNTLIAVGFLSESTTRLFSLTPSGESYAKSEPDSKDERRLLAAALLNEGGFLRVWAMVLRSSEEASVRTLSAAIGEVYELRPASANWYASFFMAFSKRGGLVESADRPHVYRVGKLLKRAAEGAPSFEDSTAQAGGERPARKGSPEFQAALIEVALGIGAISGAEDVGKVDPSPLVDRLRSLGSNAGDRNLASLLSIVADMLEAGVTIASRPLIAYSFRILSALSRSGPGG